MSTAVVDISSSTGSFQTAPTSLAIPGSAPGSVPGSGPGSGHASGSSSYIPSIYQYYHTYNTRSFIDSISSPESVTRLEELHPISSNSDKLNPVLHHQRSVSNPFDVLYDPGRRPNAAYIDLTPPKQGPPLKQGVQQIVTPPVITVIDHPEVRRTGSVISNSATLRNRKRINNRNKAFLKSPKSDTDTIDILNTAPKQQSLAEKIKFMFPVRRKKSLRYSSVRKQHANFQTKEQLQAFLANTDAESLIKELLPKQANFFHYDNILPPSPTIKTTKKHIDIVGHGRNFTIQPASALIPIAAKDHHPSQAKAKHSRAYSSIPLPDIIYQKYKTSVFNNKYQIPPKFETLFPNDLHLLSPSDIDNINRKLLLEVLLRRTLAAKIEYRLKNHFSIPRSGSTKTSGTDTTSTSGSSQSHSGKHTMMQPQSPFSSYKAKTETTTTKSYSQESINTEKLMQQNASLFSELLPSPQISYTSDIFGSIYLKDDNSIPYGSKESVSSGSRKNVPRKVSQSAISAPNASIRKVAKLPSNESLYINDFNKAYYNRYKAKTKEATGFEQTLFDSNVYQLRPMQRSVVTLSTSNRSDDDFQQTSSLISPLNLASRDDLSSNSHDRKSSYSSSSKLKRNSLPVSESTKRKSQSTTNTSIFQNLEDLSSDLSSFMEDFPREKTQGSKYIPQGPPPSSPFHATPYEAQIKRHSLSSLDKLTNPRQSLKLDLQERSASQTILESLNRSAQYSPIKIVTQPVTHESIEKQNPAIDILSLKGSISVVGSAYHTESVSESASSDFRRKSRSISRDRTKGLTIHE